MWLGSTDYPAWGGARLCTVLGEATSQLPVHAVWVQLDPVGPNGETVVILAPRYEGDTIESSSRMPVMVNIFTPPPDSSPSDTVVLTRDRLEATGQLYPNSEMAAATGRLKW